MPRKVEDASGTIKADAFSQILELDDDGSYTYSKDMVAMYFLQVPTAFAGMDAALRDADLRQLADLAHFLAGSSASLGIARVCASCERIESAGKAALAAASWDGHDKAAALTEIAALLEEVKREYGDARAWLRRWYAERGESLGETEPGVIETPEQVASGSVPADERPESPTSSNAPADLTKPEDPKSTEDAANLRDTEVVPPSVTTIRTALENLSPELDDDSEDTPKAFAAATNF